MPRPTPVAPAPERSRLAAAGALATAAAVVGLAAAAHRFRTVEVLDSRLLSRVAEHRYPHLGRIAERVAVWGDPLPQIVLSGGVVAIALARRRVDLAIAAAALLAGANVTTEALKWGISNPLHPALGYAEVAANTYPSGHVTAAAALGLALTLVVPTRWRYAAAAAGAVFTAAMGVAVLVLHRHLPSDVVGGVLVAVTWYLGAVAVLAARRAGAARSDDRPISAEESDSRRSYLVDG